MEEQPDHVAGGKEALDRVVPGIEHPSLGIDLDAAERERHAAGDAIGAERRLVDGIGPVRLVGIETDGASAVQIRRVEWHVGAAGGIVFVNRINQHFGLHTYLRGKFGDGRRFLVIVGIFRAETE